MPVLMFSTLKREVHSSGCCWMKKDCLVFVTGSGLLYLAYSADMQKYCIKHRIQQKDHALDVPKLHVETWYSKVFKVFELSP